jgi:tricorn protease-like protein
LDVATHEVRPLSRERRAQWNARWSPDGTRIAFARGIGDEPAVICVYAVDGTRLRCDAPARKLESVLGWTDDERLLVRADDGRDLEEFDTETGLYRRTGVQGATGSALSLRTDSGSCAPTNPPRKPAASR